MFSNYFRGCAYLLQGFRLIFQPGLRLFLFIPVTVNIVLFGLLIYWAKSMLGGWMASLMAWLPEWLAFMEWFFWIIYFVAILMTIFYGFVSAANLLAAPFYGYLSEIVEARLSHSKTSESFSWKTLLAMVPRTVIRELQKILYYLPRVIGLLILGLIPGINALAALLWILFSAWMMAIQYLDYPADNNHFTFPEMLGYLRKNRASALGFGSLTFGLTMLPLVNLIAFPAAVCGATAFWCHEKQGLEGLVSLDNRASPKQIGP